MKYLLKLLAALTATISGWILYFILPHDREAYRWAWADAIWGNNIDKLHGDIPYQTKEALSWPIRYFPDYWWSCWRNPCKNLQLNMGADGIVTEIRRDGYMTRALIDNKPYWMYKRSINYCFGKLRCDILLGYRLTRWDNYSENGSITPTYFETGKRCVAGFAFKISPLRKN